MGDTNNAERLENLLGFDAAKPESVTKGLLDEVVGEIQEERKKKAKVAAKEQVVKLMDQREKMYKAKKQFDGEFGKFEKEFGKMLNRLEGTLRGGPAPEETDTSED